MSETHDTVAKRRPWHLWVVGILALSYTKFDMSLTWLEDWWPVIPIGVGLYLIVVNVIERMK